MSILYNLRDHKNPELNQKILAGELAPTSVVLMGSRDLASEATKAERKQQAIDDF